MAGGARRISARKQLTDQLEMARTIGIRRSLGEPIIRGIEMLEFEIGMHAKFEPFVADQCVGNPYDGGMRHFALERAMEPSPKAPPCRLRPADAVRREADSAC